MLPPYAIEWACERGRRLCEPPHRLFLGEALQHASDHGGPGAELPARAESRGDLDPFLTPGDSRR